MTDQLALQKTKVQRLSPQKNGMKANFGQTGAPQKISPQNHHISPTPGLRPQCRPKDPCPTRSPGLPDCPWRLTVRKKVLELAHDMRVLEPPGRSNTLGEDLERKT